MNYYIAFITEDGSEWNVMESEDYEYIYDVFENLSAPPGFNMELRATEEDIDTHVSYEVLRYDHSQFPFTLDSVISWISDHETLYQDFIKRFPELDETNIYGRA